MYRSNKLKLIDIFMVALVLFAASFFWLRFAFAATEQSSSVETEKRLSEEIAAIELECESIDAHLEVTDKNITADQMELEQCQSEYSRMQRRCDHRLNEIYRNDNVSLLEVFLNLKDFEDFVVRISYLKKINQADLAMLEACKRKRAELLASKVELESSKSEKIALRQNKKQKLSELNARLSQAQERRKLAIQKLKDSKKLAARSKNSLSGSSTGTGSSKPYLNHGYVGGAKVPSNCKTSGVSFGGIASWYGNEFNGRPTASGEIFNENDFTCASKTLPFGTLLRITYGSKQVIVRVTDRGPYVEGRILDLSKAAARALGMSGIGYVTAEVVRP